jgi:hypothetical protein
MSFQKTAFVQGPVTRKEKQEFNSQGFQVVDIRFAPEKLSGDDKKVEKKAKK